MFSGVLLEFCAQYSKLQNDYNICTYVTSWPYSRPQISEKYSFKILFAFITVTVQNGFCFVFALPNIMRSRHTLRYLNIVHLFQSA